MLLLWSQQFDRSGTDEIKIFPSQFDRSGTDEIKIFPSVIFLVPFVICYWNLFCTHAPEVLSRAVLHRSGERGLFPWMSRERALLFGCHRHLIIQHTFVFYCGVLLQSYDNSPHAALRVGSWQVWFFSYSPVPCFVPSFLHS